MFIALLLFGSVNLAEHHKTPDLSISKSQKPLFNVFWKNFTTALAKNDKKAVASMTKFPFYWGEELDEAKFIKNFDKIFTPRVKRCLAKGKPTRVDEGIYDLLCGEEIYLFQIVDDVYKFTEVGAND